MKQERAHALDALRGYAIMTMILSATEAFRVLLAWMYHAQVPPPDHVFNPSIYGITWVDLIFPFFLFSMGAAIPLSLGRQYKAGASLGKLCRKSAIRWLKLAFLAIFIYHTFPFMLDYRQEWLRYAVPLAGFALMFVLYVPNPFRLPELWRRIVNGAAYVVAGAILLLQPYADGKPFSPNDYDTIILILSNVAVVGSIIYLFTMKKPYVRFVVMAFIVALFLSSETDGSWQQAVCSFTPVAWLYQPAFLKYLLIILPGTFAGNMLYRWQSEYGATDADKVTERHVAPLALAVVLAVIIANVILLYCRMMAVNLAVTVLLFAVLHWVLKGDGAETKLWRTLFHHGALYLLLGLCMEAFQGGIRKDDVTFSYLFTTTGLAFLALLAFSVISDHYRCSFISKPLELTGKNPMIAYVASSMVVIPVLTLLGIYRYIDMLSVTAWTGFLKGIILTALSMGVAVCFTKRKCFWKT